MSLGKDNLEIIQPDCDENTSGKGSLYPVPEAVKKFNWGAFLGTWIWGIGNYTYITLLFLALQLLILFLFVVYIQFIKISFELKNSNEALLVSIIFGIIILILLILLIGVSVWFGKKGNEWAWQNKHFENIEAFHAYQKKWVITSIIILLYLSIPFIIPILPIFMNAGHI